MENNTPDICTVMLALALQFALFGILAYRAPAKPTYITIPPKKIDEVYVAENVEDLEEYHTTQQQEYLESNEPTEEQIASVQTALMYATVPIGRYYITAYNHEETGGKRTASGTICHQGTITTCAADVWGGYFKFGDYIEVTVNGEPRLFRVEDTGSAVKKKHIDLYFSKYSDMARYGSNYQNISRVEFPFGKPKDN